MSENTEKNTPQSATENYREDDVLLFNTAADGRLPSEFVGKYHVHILCRKGSAEFRLANGAFRAEKNDFVIWQLSSDIRDVRFSNDFEADFLLVSKHFLGQFNPEMIWAVKGFIYIKLNPVFHLTDDEQAVCNEDFAQFRLRLKSVRSIFQAEIIGRLLQIFLFDLWNIYSREINRQEISDTSARTFFNFLQLVNVHCREQREVAFYSDKLCITPKYLSEICRKVSNIPASEWIGYYAMHELVKLLQDTTLTFPDIADRMNFSTQPFFSSYVKKMLGVSPSEYRRDMDKRG